MDKTILAGVIIRGEILPRDIKAKYVIIKDMSNTGGVDKLIKAINIMAEGGWRCVNMTTATGSGIGPAIIHTYALMERVK